MHRNFAIVILILYGIPNAAANPVNGVSSSQQVATSFSTSRLILVSGALIILGNTSHNVFTAVTKALGILLMPVSALSCVLLIIATSNRDDLPIWM